MAREQSDAAAISDMLQAAETILRYVAGKSREDYERDEMLRHAVERNIEIIGEAARRTARQFRDVHPEINWRAVLATRNILAHEYDEVDNDIIWRITKDHVPELVTHLRALLPPLPPDIEA